MSNKLVHFSGADISVIIPAYKAADTIRRALDSIVIQSIAPGEVIVIDDGSPDQTALVAEIAGTNLHGIAFTVLRQKNGGAGAARNRGIKAAKGSLLAFLDADDEWLPEKLECSLLQINRSGSVLVAHDGWIVSRDGKTILNETARRFAEGPDSFVTLYRKGYIDTCSVLARRDSVIAAGGFDESLPNAQDFELWLAMLHEPHTTFKVFTDPLVRYHINPGSIMSYTDRRLSCCIDIALRYAPLLRNRPGGKLGNLAYRLLAIHYEAIRAHFDAGCNFAALRVLVRFPLHLAAALVSVRTEWTKRQSYLGSA